MFWVASVFWAVASVSVYPTLRASAPRPGQGMEDIATKLLTFAASSSSSSAGISAVNSVSRSASVAVSVISSSAFTTSSFVGAFSVAPLSRRASASALGLLLAVVAATLSDSETARTATSTSRAAWGRMVLVVGYLSKKNEVVAREQSNSVCQRVLSVSQACVIQMAPDSRFALHIGGSGGHRGGSGMPTHSPHALAASHPRQPFALPTIHNPLTDKH